MRFFASFVLLLSVSSAAFGNEVANNFIDLVLTQMRSAVSASRLDPVFATPFSVLVEGNSITSIQFKGNFSSGSIVGLSQLYRWGDCTYGTSGNQYKIGCNIALSELRVHFNAEVKGDSILRTKHSITTSTTVSDFILVEIEGSRGYTPRLDSISETSTTLNTKVVEGQVDLNTHRFSEFLKQVNSNVTAQIHRVMTGPYFEVFNNVLRFYKMP